MSETSICLCVIYNHNHEKTVPLLREYYGKNFDKIVFLMPFYRGNEADIIPYYNKSHLFQASVNQAYPKLKEINASHYVFIADDLVLNPIINQYNVLDYLGGKENIAFCGAFDLINASKWVQLRSVINFDYNASGVNWKNLLPTYDKMKEILAKKGFDYKINLSEVVNNLKKLNYIDIPSYATRALSEHNKQNIWQKIISIIMPKTFSKPPLIVEPQYPCVGGYSDIFVIPNHLFDDFSHYCGVTTAMGIFVEIAIPMIVLILSPNYDTIKTIDYMKLLEEKEFAGIANFSVGKNDCPFTLAAELQLSKAFQGKFSNVLFYHPIKLSNEKMPVSAGPGAAILKWTL